MKSAEEIKIDISKPTKEFYFHLKPEDNKRIIFSGVFGIGKTYFLEKFFEEKKEEYLTIRVSPVNYTIASNEDIFNLIKYDILYEIIVTHQFEPDIEEFDEKIFNSVFVAENMSNILLSLIELLPEFGKESSKAIKHLAELFEKYESQKKKIKKGEAVVNLEKYRRKIEGSHYLFERNYITEFIQYALTKLTDGKRKRVLIIDDLDRIDPEHIFRIFNIFSGHFDYRKEAENKFGFDKIIFACDINNIRNIFHSKYGDNTDFSGYIDKFYSREIFYFDNREAIEKMILEIFKSFKIENNSYKMWSEDVKIDYYVSTIIADMVYANAINLRNLLRLQGQTINFSNKYIPFIGHENRYYTSQFKAIENIELLNQFFGDSNSLLKAINKAKEYKKSSGKNNIQRGNEHWHFIGQLLVVLAYRSHNFGNKEHIGSKIKYSYSFQIDKTNKDLEFTIEEKSRCFYSQLSSEGYESSDYYHLLYDTVVMLKTMNVLK